MSATYRMVRCEGHPKATSQHQVCEHVLVAESALGKYLPPGAQVHHVNGNKRDNRSSNLVICQDAAYHNMLHRRARIVARGGNPNTQRICCTCKVLRLLTDMTGLKSNGYERAQCRDCKRAFDRRAYKRRKETNMSDAWTARERAILGGDPSL